MAYYATTIRIAGVRVKVADGFDSRAAVERTQTVNVFDVTNTDGLYRQVYRIKDPEQWVEPYELERSVQSLAELDTLMDARGAVREGPRGPRR